MTDTSQFTTERIPEVETLSSDERYFYAELYSALKSNKGEVLNLHARYSIGRISEMMGMLAKCSDAGVLEYDGDGKVRLTNECIECGELCKEDVCNECSERFSELMQDELEGVDKLSEKTAERSIELSEAVLFSEMKGHSAPMIFYGDGVHSTDMTGWKSSKVMESFCRKVLMEDE